MCLLDLMCLVHPVNSFDLLQLCVSRPTLALCVIENIVEGRGVRSGITTTTVAARSSLLRTKV